MARGSFSTDFGDVSPITLRVIHKMAHQESLRLSAFHEARLKRSHTVVVDVSFADGKTLVHRTSAYQVGIPHTDGRYHIRVRVHRQWWT